MWKGSGDDPPLGADGAPPIQELDDLKEQNEHQQKLIAQLQEMLNKSDPGGVSQEKVVKYANTLSKLKTRAMKSQHKDPDSKVNKAEFTETSNEKLKLLRQQLEENKAKLAERGKSQKGLEEKVTQLKAQLDSSQQQIYQTTQAAPLNISLIDDRVDYTPADSSQELYNILLNKDKRIGELNAKISKLQTSVLDLQENVKEKDSVLDARTKAITLMSENLSKKGKNTLDALDETKMQMRQMQESFISKEEEYKNTIDLLKTELVKKSSEIEDLKGANEELVINNKSLQLNETKLLTKIKELESKSNSPQRSPSKSRKSKKGKFPSKAEAEVESLSSEIKKITNEKADLMENNEKVICTLNKEHDNKVKELENEILHLKNELEAMKLKDEAPNLNSSDLKHQLDEANKAMIKVKAQHKSKLKELNRKIESFKSVSDSNAEIVKLENENSQLKFKITELEANNPKEAVETPSENVGKLEEIIETLKSENEKLQTKISTLNEQLDSLKTQSNFQITNELASVQYEEQLEALEKEKTNLQSQLEANLKELQEIKTEKQVLQQKFDCSTLENQELLNRLEKLTTEKMSSAESIEIVENLTLQEKLEIEAFQQQNNSDAPSNSEETAELLQKIELFTVERREVMEKMESLQAENKSLSFKIKEVENNRDVLVETYEELQTEKEQLDVKLQEYEELLKKTNKFSEEINEYKSLIEIQKEEIRELKVELLSFTTNSRVDGKSNEEQDKKMKIEDFKLLEEQLKDAKNLNENYAEIIEENKDDLIKYSVLLKDFENQCEIIENLKRENQDLSDKISELNEQLEEINNWQKDHEQETIDKNKEMSSELFILQNTLQENLQQVENYQKELLINSKTVKELENQLENLNKQLTAMEELQKEKDAEILSLRKSNGEFNNLKEKCLKLEAQYTENEKQFLPMKKRMEELEEKNKQQIEKMKKIAANLKKRNSEYQQLESKHQQLLEELQNQKSKPQESANLNEELETLRKQLQLKTADFSNLEMELREKCEENEQIKQRNSSINNQLIGLTAQIDHLQNLVHEYEMQVSGLNRELELARSNANDQSNVEREEAIRRLNEEVEAFKDQCGALQTKIHDQELLIEKQTNDLCEYKQQIDLLEQQVVEMQQMRSQFEENSSGIQQELTAEKQQREFLENDLRTFSEENKSLKEKINQLIAEKSNLENDLEMSLGENQNYKKEINVFNVKLQEYEANKEFCATLESEKYQLEHKIRDLESEIRKLNLDLNVVVSETERSDNELQEQLDLNANDRKQLLEQLELSREEVSTLIEAKTELQALVEDLNRKLDQQQKEFEEILQKYHLLEEQHKQNLSKLDSMLQKSPNVSELQSLLESKMQELEEFKKSYVPSPADFFYSENALGKNESVKNLEEEINTLKRQLSSLDADKFWETQEELAETKAQLNFAKNMLSQIEESNLATLGQNDQLKKELEFVTQASSASNVAKNASELQMDLEQKAKALEFMLYNTEKEKEQAIAQCEQLSHELAQLIYEKQENSSKLEQQILSASSAELSQEPKISFEKSKAPEECLEAAEDLCVQKTAYQCEPNQPDNSFGNLDDDGWAFNAEEAKLEQEHMEKNEISELRLKISALEAEKEAHLKELQEAHVKSGKLIKKLKEYKVKNDQLTAKMKNDDFDGLIDALQDELRSKIQTLENRLKEMQSELDRERMEKENITKKVDVLTSANERLVEMKEKQDVEVLVLQQNLRELNAKVENFEWDTPSTEKTIPAVSTAVTPDTNVDSSAESNDQNDNKVLELNKIIKELTLDNEELQNLLEEQRKLRLEAEKTCKNQTDYQSLIEEREKLQNYQVLYEQLQNDNEKLQNICAELNLQITNLNDRQKESVSEAEETKGKLQSLYMEKTQMEAVILEANIQVDSLKNDLSELNQQLSVKEGEVQNLQLKISELQSKNNAVADFEEMEVEITSLKEQIASKEEEHLAAMQQLAMEWSQHVDQRGNDVAESWSNHLNNREAEFQNLEQSLRAEISEVEQKCQALLAENQQLRQNVDEEMRNEVDKISALQAEIANGQKQLLQLNESLAVKDAELMKVQNDFANLQLKLQDYQKIIDANAAKFKDFQLEKEQLQSLLENKDVEILTLKKSVKSLSENQQDNAEVLAANENLQRKLMECQPMLQANEEVKSLLEERNVEISQGKLEIEQLKQTVESLSNDLQSFAEVLARNQSLQQEISHYQQIIESLQTKVSNLEEQLAEHNLNLSNAKGNLQERDYQISELSRRLEELQQTTASNSQLQQQIHDLQHQINDYTVQLQENCLYIETLNQEIESCKTFKDNAALKDAEVSKLRNLLSEKERDFEYQLQNQLQESQSVLNAQNEELDALKRRAHNLEMQLDEADNSKETEVGSYKAQLEEINENFHKVQEALSEREKTLGELEIIIAEDEKQLNELKSIIEEQTLKIEGLNGEIYEKSSQYDALVAELDGPQKLQSSAASSSASSRKEEDATEMVSRAELDLAHYMLHQRDMRCEELTVELMQLLEERDTLQLRLSNAIREMESIKSQNPELNTTTGGTSEGKTETSEKVTESGPSKDSLANKISELKIVGYKKDKTLKDDQELRRLQQMAILEQCKDDLSKMPPEAAARLVDASYTLSRDVQSPSKVLLNWLWGKSTPKVNDL